MQSDFLNHPPKCLTAIHNPQIVSFGVGYHADVEIGALNNLFGTHYVYTGIELDPSKVNFYTNLSSNMKMVAADGSDWFALQKLGLKPNRYDIAIVRHPNFAENSEAFKKIFRVVIPRLLKKGGQLIISLYNEAETFFFVEKDKPTLDSFLFKVQYQLRDQRVLDKVDLTLPKIGLGSHTDKYMFYFENNYNSDPENQSKYVVNLITDHEVNERIGQTICKLGGCTSILGSTMVAKITAGYMDALVRHWKVDASSFPQQEPSQNVALAYLNLLTPEFHWKWSDKQQTFWLQVQEKEVQLIKNYLEKQVNYDLNKVQNATDYVFRVQKVVKQISDGSA